MPTEKSIKKFISNEVSETLLAILKRLFYSFPHIFENVLSHLQFEELMLIHLCCGDEEIKKFILPKLKIGGILQLSGNFMESKPQFTSFNLDIQLKDVNHCDFIFMFKNLLLMKCDYMPIHRPDYILKNNGHAIPFLINFDTNPIGDSKESFYFLKHRKEDYENSARRRNDIGVGYSDLDKVFLTSLVGNKSTTTYPNDNGFRLFIGVTTTSEYLSYVDKFFTLFKWFLDAIYHKARMEWNEIISSELFQEEFKDEAIWFWTGIDSIYKIDYETLPDFSKEYGVDEADKGFQFFRSLPARFYRSHASEDCVNIILECTNRKLPREISGYPRLSFIQQLDLILFFLHNFIKISNGFSFWD